MDINATSLVLPIIYALVGAVLVWFVIELILLIRQIRKTVVNQVNPTLENADKIISDLQPTIAKVDPLVERVTLTVDTVNLELMRVDTILDDVTHITGGVSKTVNAVDTVANAPLDIVTNVTKKMRSRLRPKYASDTSVDLGSHAGQASANAQTNSQDAAQENPFVEFVDVAGSAAAQTIRQEAHRIREDVKGA